MINACPVEFLIATLMSQRQMDRETAIVALVMEDERERHFGRPPLVDGPPLSERYAADMETELSKENAVKVVSYLLGVSEEEAAEDIASKVADGTLYFETKH